jgi:hypothetical protein
MKIKELYGELLEIAKSIGFSIKKDNGNFHGGACVLYDERIILLNKNVPLEAHINIIANAIAPYINEIFIKPKVRELIEKEIDRGLNNPIEIIVKNKEE